MVYVSNGRLSAVPDVTGVKVNDARAALESQGWKVGSVRQEVTNAGCDPSVVLKTDPWAGYQGIKEDMTINIIICKKP